jgi:hypothetical protein
LATTAATPGLPKLALANSGLPALVLAFKKKSIAASANVPRSAA